jgi:hypothetical protein
MDPNCEQRRASTVATQSLMLMNSDFILNVAADFADRVAGEAGEASAAQIDRLWEIAFNRLPTPDERQAAIDFLTDQQAALVKREAATDGKQPAGNASRRALRMLCQTVLSSNAFLYID